MFIQIFLALSLAFIAFPALAKSSVTACPSPKFLYLNYPGDICDTLNAKKDSDLILFTIGIHHPPPDSENDPSQGMLLKARTHDMFTKYILNDLSGMKRLPVPADSQLSYVYSSITVSKLTALTMVQEEYISVLQYERFPGTGIRRPRAPVGWASGSVEKWFDVSGKTKDGISHGYNLPFIRP